MAAIPDWLSSAYTSRLPWPVGLSWLSAPYAMNGAVIVRVNAMAAADLRGILIGIVVSVVVLSACAGRLNRSGPSKYWLRTLNITMPMPRKQLLEIVEGGGPERRPERASMTPVSRLDVAAS